MFQNIEFYNTPEGDVMIKAVNEPARRLKENDYEFISEMLTILLVIDILRLMQH